MIQTGLTDGRVTEVVSGNLQESDVIVTGQNGGAAASKPQQQNASPFGQQRTGGGGRGRGN
jgi:HlyD family secretion protein